MATTFKKKRRFLQQRKRKKTTSTSGIFGTEPELDSKDSQCVSDVRWEINRDDLLLTRKIKDGIYEGVLRCDGDSSEIRVAAKYCDRFSNKGVFLKEADIMKNLNSHHVVKLIGLLTIQEPIGIVTELMAHRDLECFLRHHNPKYEEYDGRDPLSWMQMLQMCGEIADGMVHLSDMNYFHRDLRSGNCYVGEDMTVKIGGFALASDISQENEYVSLGDSYFTKWRAPEISAGGRFTTKADVWSYGALIWEIATLGRSPSDTFRSLHHLLHYIHSGKTLAIPEAVHSKMRDLMNMCWKFEPSQRPTFSDILEILEPDLNDKFHKVCYFHRDERNVPDDFVHDSYALDLYKKALQEGKEEDCSIRVNIVGNFGQGKTSLVRRLVGESIEGVHSTNGIAVDRYECKKEKDGTFSYIRKETLDNSDIGSRLVAVARATTMEQEDTYCNTNFEPLDFEKAELAELQDKLQDTVIYDGNSGHEEVYEGVSSLQVKNVQRSSQSHEQKQKRQYFMGKAGFKIFEENLNSNTYSANDNNIPVSMDIWDFGGQHTFYATHTIFHSRRAIYLLVFNLSENLREQAKDEDESEDCFLLPRNRDMAYYLRFWMNSIHSFVGNGDGTEPPVILVGTHKDKLSGNEEDKQSQADKYFCDVRDLFGDKQVINHIRPDDFAIDNTNRSDESIRLLRETIIQLGEEKSKTVSVPAKWIQLEKALFEKRTSRIISLAMVMEMDAENEFPIGNIEEIKLFLKYHHNKGTVCYFDEEPISNHVVVDPQYLIDSFKCIITSGIFCRKDTELRNFWQKLLKEAKLEHTLIDKVWGRDKDKEFPKHKSILIAFLKKHHVISEAMRYDPTKKVCEELGWFVVPSFLRNHSSETTEIDDFLRGKQQSLSRYVLTFEYSAVVPTIYHRVVAASLGKWPVAQFQSTNLIYENLLALRLDIYHDGLIELKNSHIEISVVSLCPSTQVISVTADKLRRFVESVVEYEFGKLRDVAGEVKKPYVRHLRCNHPSHGLYGSINLLELPQSTGRKILPCPDSMSHEIAIEKTMTEWFLDSESLLNIPKQQLPQKILSRISHAIGNNWESLGLELGLTEIEIQHVIADNPTSMFLRIYKMLTRWNKKMADTATMDVLVQAMRHCPEVSVDWDIIRNVIDDIV